MTADLAERVTAAKAGDRSAFDDLVRATYADAYTLAYRLVGNEEDARDVVQEAYLRAYKSLKKFREDAAFSTWLSYSSNPDWVAEVGSAAKAYAT